MRSDQCVHLIVLIESLLPGAGYNCPAYHQDGHQECTTFSDFVAGPSRACKAPGDGMGQIREGFST